jgi:hypothetical protein
MAFTPEVIYQALNAVLRGKDFPFSLPVQKRFMEETKLITKVPRPAEAGKRGSPGFMLTMTAKGRNWMLRNAEKFAPPKRGRKPAVATMLQAAPARARGAANASRVTKVTAKATAAKATPKAAKATVAKAPTPRRVSSANRPVNRDAMISRLLDTANKMTEHANELKAQAAAVRKEGAVEHAAG